MIGGIYAPEGRRGCPWIRPGADRGVDWADSAAEMQMQRLVTHAPRIYFKPEDYSTLSSTFRHTFYTDTVVDGLHLSFWHSHASSQPIQYADGGPSQLPVFNVPFRTWHVSPE
jgi:hypothetical protein